MIDSEKMNILVVDDDPNSLLAMEAVLHDLGQNVVKAHSGGEALRHVLAMDFAVILLDVQMPVIDGFETAALIRERERSKTTPIIFLTAAMRSDAWVFKGYSIGAVDYLFKPLLPEILRSKVEVFVELARKTAQLRRLNGQLHDQTAQLAAANLELEAFSYSVAHDLRAPLRSIDGFSRALLEDCADKLDEKGKTYLGNVRESAQQMAQLIDDLLGLSRVSRAELRRSRIDLADIARAVMSRLQRDHSDRMVELLVPDEVAAVGDERLLAVALENLLGNAWKFTGKRSQARIEFGQRLEAGHSVYFVRDNGAGFDMAYARKLFGIFQRLHSASDFEGTGIGLAIVQRVIHRHGGRVWAEGQVDHGATFFFTLEEGA